MMNNFIFIESKANLTNYERNYIWLLLDIDLFWGQLNRLNIFSQGKRKTRVHRIVHIIPQSDVNTAVGSKLGTYIRTRSCCVKLQRRVDMRTA